MGQIAEQLPPLVWRPKSHSQEIFFRLRHVTELLAEGNRYGGKSDALFMSFADQCEQGWGPAWRGVMFRRTHKQLTDIIDRTRYWFDPIFGGRATFNESKSEWTWDTGEKLLFRYMDTDNDFAEYKGNAYTWLGWEELTLWPNDKCYKAMLSCLRSTFQKPDGQKIYLMCRSTTNPGDIGHGWVRRRWRLPEFRNKVIRIRNVNEQTKQETITTRGSIFFDYRGNKQVMTTDPEYVVRSVLPAARNEAERRAWAFGDWDIPAGGIFDEAWYKANQHSVLPSWDPKLTPDDWRMFRAYDHGESHPFSVGWWAVSDGSDIDVPAIYTGSAAPVRLKMSTVPGDMFRLAEWYGWNGQANEGVRKLYSDISLGIIQSEIDWKIDDRVQPGPADDSIFDVANGQSVALDMAKNVEINGEVYTGARFVRAGKGRGSRVRGWNKVREMMIGAIKNGHAKREKPGLFVLDRCAHFLRTIPELPRSKTDPNDADSEAEDHVADEVRYACFTAGRGVTAKPRDE